MQTLFEDKNGPIEKFSWGTFVINGKTHTKTMQGKEGAGKDVKIVDNKVKAWKERKGHTLTADMLTSAWRKPAKVVIIGNGVDGAVEVTNEVERTLKNHKIEKLIVEKTPEACRVFNEMARSGESVAFFAHGTC